MRIAWPQRTCGAPGHLPDHATCTHAGGRFFAPNFQARATWDLTEDKRLLINWAKFGNYELTMKGSSPPEFEVVSVPTSVPCSALAAQSVRQHLLKHVMQGSAVGDPANWRKMKRREGFSVAEKKLLDSVWEFQHRGRHDTKFLCARSCARCYAA